MVIYKELWDKVKEEYNEQTVYGNVYNMNIEVLMSNPFVINRVITKDKESLKILKQGLLDSFDVSIEFITKEKV